MSLPEIAKSWAGTPFLGGAYPATKGRAADCCSFIAAVLLEAGVIAQLPDVPNYDANAPWAKGSEIIVEQLEKIAEPIHESRVRAGDIVVFAMGRGWAHAGIVIGERLIAHADGREGVIISGLDAGKLRGRRRRFWRVRTV